MNIENPFLPIRIFEQNRIYCYLFLVLPLFLQFCYAENKKTVDQWREYLAPDTLDVLVNGKRSGVMITGFTFDDTIVTSNVSLSVSQNGQKLVDLTEKRSYLFDGSLSKAFQEMKSPSGSSIWELNRRKGVWNITIITAGVRNTRIISSVYEKLTGTLEIYKGIKTKSIHVGDQWIDTLIELTSGENVITTTRCTDVPSEKNKFRWIFVSTNSLQGGEEYRELDTNGSSLYHEIPPFVAVKRGISPVRSSKTEAGSANLFESFMVKVQEPPIKNGHTTVVTDSGVTLDSSVLSMYKKNGPSRFLLEYEDCFCKDSDPSKLSDTSKIYLKPTPTLQTDHPEIVALAQKLSEKHSTVCQKIANYTNYVSAAIENRNTATFSSAVETLRAGFGDCGEHAVLLAALLRASGVPARVVFGLVYMESLKGYYGHAWVMAFDGKRWIFTDPAHNVFPACYNRIPLLVDDSGQQMIHIIKLLGKVSIVHEE
ncbi:MAG: transglutaminase domain-containing protein [Chitinispirillaceae bacterium]|nr:transglutaminase domain-containing protein [Chitinispirillaceae bacterium]